MANDHIRRLERTISTYFYGSVQVGIVRNYYKQVYNTVVIKIKANKFLFSTRFRNTT